MRKFVAFLALLTATSLNAAVTGHVATEEGSPLAGARVRAYERETERLLKARVLSQAPEPAPLATATTGDDGAFSLDVKAPAIDLVIDAPGRQVELGEAANGEYAGTFLLPRSKPRRGRVTFGGKGVANAAVITARALVARTDADGYYEAADVATPSPIVVVHPDYAIGDTSVFTRERTGPGANAVLKRGVTVRGKVVAADRTTAVPNAVIGVDGWPLATSGEDGTFAIAHASDRWRALTASDDTRAAVVSRSRADSYMLVLAPAATLSGTVINDRNAPVNGARLWIAPQFEFGFAPSAIADAKGNFSLSGLAAGSYNIAVSVPGFVMPPASVDLAPGSRVRRSLSLTPLPRISGFVVDEERKPVGAVTIQLPFGSKSVSGVDGRFSLTLSQSGQPIYFVARKHGYAPAIVGPFAAQSGQSRAGVTVTLARGFPFRLRVEDGDKQPVVDEPVTIVRPADDDRFSQQNVLICGDRRGVPACHTDSNGAVSLALTEWKYEIAVGGGSVPVRRIAPQILSKRNSSVTVTVERGVEVSGRVTFADGSPIDSTNVMILAKDVQLRQAGGGEPLDADGAFSLRNVPPGKVTLSAQLMGASPIEGPSVEITAPAKNVVLTLPRPLRIEGRVVEKENNRPVRSFSVGIRRYRGRGYGGDTRSFNSDEGTFALDDIAPGPIELFVSAAGYAPASVSNAALSEKGPLTIQLERGAVIAGRVTSEGSPVADANVSFSGGVRQTYSPRNSVTTDAQGEFRFDSASTGDYTVSVFKKGFAQVRKNVEVTSEKEARVDVELQRGQQLRGRVVDWQGRPVPLARVYARGAPNTPSSQSDPDGGFELDGIPEGKYTVTAEKSGYVSATLDDVDPRNAQTITLTLQEGGTITGRVTGLSERELSLTRVNAGGGGMMASSRVDATGAFTLTGIPDGIVRVQATVMGPANRSSAARNVEVLHGSASPVDLDFGASFNVSGRVMRGGAPLPSAQVSFDPVVYNGSTGLDQTSSDGRYEVSVSTPGEYNVAVEFGPAGRYEAGKVNISGPMSYDIDVRGSGVKGRVIDDSGAPIPGASVVASGTGTRGVSTLTDGEGRFSIDLLTAGRYTIRASKTRYPSDSRQVDLREGVPGEVEITLRQGERVGFRGVDATTGKTIDNLSITVQDSAKKVVQSGPAVKDENGLWRVWVTPGRYSARVYAPRYISQTVDFAAPGPDVLVTMRPAGRIVLQGIAEGSVRARLLDPTTRRSVMVTAIPPAIFDGVAPGTYQVQLVDRNGVVLVSREVTVPGSDTVTLPMN